MNPSDLRVFCRLSASDGLLPCSPANCPSDPGMPGSIRRAGLMPGSTESVAKYRDYFTKFQALLQELDLDGIARLALRTPGRGDAAPKCGPAAVNANETVGPAH